MNETKMRMKQLGNCSLKLKLELKWFDEYSDEKLKWLSETNQNWNETEMIDTELIK